MKYSDAISSRDSRARLKALLLASAASAVLITQPSLAADGDGGAAGSGRGGGYSAAGSGGGGGGSNTVGDDGSNTTGGNGGITLNGTPGGSGGNSVNGGNGANGSGTIGGGGGGGLRGFSGTASDFISSPLAVFQGGSGGNGGSGGTWAGGGGGGGAGAVIDGGSFSGQTLSATVTGGSGGSGGNSPNGGNGGNGGTGLLLRNLSASSLAITGSVTGGAGGGGVSAATGGLAGAGARGLAVEGNGGTVTLTITGSVTGGVGGSGGIQGAGGVGIEGESLNLIVSGTVSGGLSGAGATRSSAIKFTGGENTLELRAGSSGQLPTISGSVEHAGANDTFILGGDISNASGQEFDLSNLGPGGAYGAFGELKKTGTSTWSVTGVSASTAPWTISAGTLALTGTGDISSSSSVTVDATFDVSGIAAAGTTVKTLSGAATGRVLLGGKTLTVSQNADGTFAGVISGVGGALVKQGSSTLTLTGVNTYTGGTTISAGTLQIGDGGMTGSITGNVENNATLVFNRSDAYVFSDVVSGSGALIKDGAGTLTLTGVNTYTGGTTISAGTLQIGDGGMTGSITGNVENNATLVFNRSDAYVFSDVVSGSGALIKDGAGTLTLTGVNTYTGGTTISTGTLALTGTGDISASSSVVVDAVFDMSGVIAAGATVKTLSGSATGQVLLGGKTLTVNQGADGTFAGVISGVGGALVKQGSSTLTLTGVNTYTGGTTISAGTLQIGDGGITGSITGNVENNATLVFNRSDAYVFSDVVSGAGALIKDGAGTLTLTGVNTYTGATTISGGTLALTGAGDISASSGVTVDATFDISGITAAGATIQSLTGTATGQVLLGDKTLTVDQNADGTFAGVISGTGALIKDGAGTLTLTGVNTYTGATTISAGTLALTGASDISASSGVTVDATFDMSGITAAGATIQSLTGAATGQVLLGDKTLTVNQNANGTFAGVISGVGGTLVKQGTGTLTLAGVNTYTGATTISAGALALTGTGDISSSSRVTVDAILDMSGISAAGATIQSLTGATTGQVRLGGKTLTVNQNANGTFAGVISGTGALVKQGTGTLTLTGVNTYTGGTTISAGTLQIGNGGTSGSVVGTVVNNGALVFNRSDTYVFSGTISGTGTVTFSGGGTVRFSDPGAYTGPITVAGAAMHLEDGSVTTSPFTLRDGGVISGNGAIGGLRVRSGGVVAPGNSPGTLAVNGFIVFEAGSLYRVDVTPDGRHDLIQATGAVTIDSGAAVRVIAVPGAYQPNTTYAIVTTSGTVNGTFGPVSSDYAFLTPTLSYDSQHVFLTLVYGAGDGGPQDGSTAGGADSGGSTSGSNTAGETGTTNGTSGAGGTSPAPSPRFASYATTSNEAGAANAAQALGLGNALFDAIVMLPVSGVPGTFSAISGEVYPSVDSVIQQQSVYVREAVGARLRQSVTAPGAQPLAYASKAAGPQTAMLGANLTPTLWAQGYGGWGNSFSNGNAATISNSLGGFLIGADVALAPNARAGLFGGYSQSQFDVDARSSSGTIDNYDLGAYAGAQLGSFALRGGVAYTWHDVSVNRAVAFTGFSQQVSGGYTTGTTQLFGEVGYDVALGAYAFEPFAGLAYVNVSGASFTESGGASALQVSTGSMETLYTTLGVRAATSFDVQGRALTPSVTLGWQHAFGDTTPIATMLFAGGATPFSVSGVPIAEDALLVEAGLSYALSNAAALSVNYSGQLAASASQNAFTAQFSLKF